MNEPRRVRFSEISTFLKCRRKHLYEWVQELEAITLDDRLLVGTWGHAALKILLKGGNEEEARSEIAQNMVDYFGPRNLSGEHQDKANLALRCACIAAKRFLKKYEPVMVEEGLKHEVHFPQYSVSVLLTGTPDVVAKDKASGALWLFDHKFRNTFRPQESELLNLQMAFYSKLLSVNGVEVVGSKQFQIKPVEPKIPPYTADGRISKKKITTDWETYSQAVLDAGLDLKDYQDMKATLNSKDKFFDLETCSALRSKNEIDTVWQDTILPVLEDIVLAHATKDERKAYRCFDFSACNLCPMRAICVADMKGDDSSQLMRYKYKKKGTELTVIQLIDDDETVQSQ